MYLYTFLHLYIYMSCEILLIKIRCRNIKQKWNSFFVFDLVLKYEKTCCYSAI